METSDRGRDGLDLHERNFRLANLVWQVVMVAVHCVAQGVHFTSVGRRQRRTIMSRQHQLVVSVFSLAWLFFPTLNLSVITKTGSNIFRLPFYSD